MNFWLVKQEPSKYNWQQLVEDKETPWDGVRNYQARNNLRAMKKADAVLFYHSVVGKAVMGIAQVAREAYRDPTTTDERWVAVNLRPVIPLKKPVSLESIKCHPDLRNMALIKQSRLSVMPLTEAEFRAILEIGATSFK